jgi:SAM domain (Sterile alpha motif)
MDLRGGDRVREASVDIAGWLHGLGLEQYEQAFRENAIDDAVLLELTADDLKELGVSLVGHRWKLRAAIAAVRIENGPEPRAEARSVADRFQAALRGSPRLNRGVTEARGRSVIVAEPMLRGLHHIYEVAARYSPTTAVEPAPAACQRAQQHVQA